MSTSDPLEGLRSPEPSPLDGWSVVVTRPLEQARTLIDALEHHGAGVLAVPTIAIEPPDDGGARLHEAARNVSEFDWIVFTSENAVDRLLQAVGDARHMGAARVAAIGEGTADVLLRHGVVADLVPQRYVAEALVGAFPPRQAAWKGPLAARRSGERRRAGRDPSPRLGGRSRAGI